MGRGTVSPVCCGAPRRTRHCPDCGLRLIPDGTLGDLLLHLIQQANTHRNESNRLTMIQDDDKPHLKKSLERELALVAKWEGWVSTLSDLIIRMGGLDGGRV